MADERDPKVTQRYRELPGEEPSRELDQHILAAAHRAAGHSHAPLVTPAGRHRWYFSLAAAASGQVLSAPAEPRARSQAQARIVETPEQWLQRIGRMRELGMDEEADKALAEFRKRYPDYRISAEVRAKVERPPVPAAR